MNLGNWLILLVIAAAAYVLWQIREVLLLIFAAVVLANSLNLLTRWLQGKGIQRSMAVLLSFASLLAFVALFFALVVPPFINQLQDVLELVPQGMDELNRWVDSLDDAAPSGIRQYLPNVSSLLQQAIPFLNRLLGGSFAFFSTSLGVGVNILLILVLGLMLLLNPVAYRQGFIRLFPAFYRHRIDAILRECEEALGRWIVGALISMSVIAVFSTLGLTLIGVKASLANGILAGLLNFIPNLGPTFSVVPPMAIALLDSPVKAGLVLLLYILIQQFESNLLTPFVMAQQVNLLPAITLLAQVFFATIFGFWGLLLALPLTVVAQIWVRRIVVEDVMDRWHRPQNRKSPSESSAPPEGSQISEEPSGGGQNSV